ncbi:acyl-CoA thioesterase, partial [Pseudomonas simiae]|uniref:acyl-CoA thioesterase n=1 Tax=Pseudomonas simiae TaxID=321846 RepID=UPI00358E81F4
TWIVDWDQRLKITRRFQLVLPRDGAILLRAHTTFVCIQLSTGKPKRMPAEFLDGYGPALTGRSRLLSATQYTAPRFSLSV